MANAVIRRTLVAVLAAQPFCRTDVPETIDCEQASVPRADCWNFSFPCHISTEDDHPGEQIALLQVDLQMHNYTQDVALNSSHQGYLQAQQVVIDTTKQATLLHSNSSLNSSAVTPMSAAHATLLQSNSSLNSSVVTAMSSVHAAHIKHESNTAYSAYVFILMFALILCVLGAREMIANFGRAYPDPLTNKVPPANSTVPQHDYAHVYQRKEKGVRRNLPFGSSASLPSQRSQSGRATGTAAGEQYPSAQGLLSSRSMYSSSTTSTIAQRISPRSTGQPQSASQHILTPTGSSHIVSARPSHFFSAEGIPVICPQMVFWEMDCRLTIPMKEIMELATSSHTQQLSILNIKAWTSKIVLQARVVITPEDGRKSFVITSLLGDLPRAFVKPNGPGEPFDVIGPKKDVYGTLAHFGDGSAVLSHHDRPVMKITKIQGLPHLHMTASRMDGRDIAKALPDEGENWKLTVCPGADPVLISACMIGLVLFGHE